VHRAARSQADARHERAATAAAARPGGPPGPECQPNAGAPLLRDERARREWLEHELGLACQARGRPETLSHTLTAHVRRRHARRRYACSQPPLQADRRRAARPRGALGPPAGRLALPSERLARGTPCPRHEARARAGGSRSSCSACWRARRRCARRPRGAWRTCSARPRAASSRPRATPRRWTRRSSSTARRRARGPGGAPRAAARRAPAPSHPPT